MTDTTATPETTITITGNADGSDNVQMTQGDTTVTITNAAVNVVPYVATPVPTPPAPPVLPTTPIGQTLTPSATTVSVGDTFTVSGVLNYDGDTSGPVPEYSLAYDKTLLSAPNSWTPTFTALAAGTATIMNSDRGTSASCKVTVTA